MPNEFFRTRRARTNEPFVDYSKSLISQRWKDPDSEARRYAFGSGAMGAAIGLLLSRLAGAERGGMIASGLAGGGIGAMVGHAAGKHEAESENSKLLYRRRRLGINEPGELEAFLRFPQRPEGAIEREKKASVGSALLKGLGYATVIPAGYALGHEVTPRLSGYDDDRQAKRISGTLGASTAALALASILAKKPVDKRRLKYMALGGLTSGELIPSGARAMNVTAASNKAIAEAQRDAADRSLGGVLKDVVTSGAGRGAATGAGLAGLGALLTGLTRARNEQELVDGTPRSGMVLRDFSKYVVPAALAGGAIGSLK